MLALAGDDPAALAQLDARLPALAPALAAAANLERARIFYRRGSQAEALAAARAVLSNDAASGQDLVGAGEILEAGGDLATAMRAYQQAQPTYPIASYLAARLKVLGGDVDNALEMLERAVTDTGGAVRALVERDLALWQPCAGAERFQMLFPDLETARPGR
jgi:tetratricopeptide (TPR) repeat protein